jgi:7-cyano-7-deazaguanine reductase
MSTPDLSPLGRDTTYPRHYDRQLLFPIDRAGQRQALGIGTVLPFAGEDIWTAYELSWLDMTGKPQVAMATFRVSAASPRMIESKSLKLYLNGFALTRFDSPTAVHEVIVRDLSEASGATVAVELAVGPAMAQTLAQLADLDGESIDDLPLGVDGAVGPDAALLSSRPATGDEAQVLVSRLFRSNCPVTGQPDWADVQVRVQGAFVEPASLLRYLVAFREHQGFHEQCVERIFLDVQQACAPTTLTVYARFTRRGGLDINPWRSNDIAFAAPANVRTPRQ